MVLHSSHQELELKQKPEFLFHQFWHVFSGHVKSGQKPERAQKALEKDLKTL